MFFALLFLLSFLSAHAVSDGDEGIDFSSGDYQEIDDPGLYSFQYDDDSPDEEQDVEYGGEDSEFDAMAPSATVQVEKNHYGNDLVHVSAYDTSLWLKSIIDGSNYLFNDLVMDQLIIPFSRFAGECQDIINHHIIDPVRRGKHYLRYMDSVMLGTFDNMLSEDTGTSNWPFALVGVPYGFIVKNIVSDFKLGSEVHSPGVVDSRYHNHPVLVERLGAETEEVGAKMTGTHKNELVVIDVVKPFMPRLELWDEENSLFSSLYHFYYATRQLVTDVHQIIAFEDTDYFQRTGRYEESDRTFLYHWNKTVSKRSALRNGQIVRVDRKGYFSMGPIPVAWNYCEVMLHEGGTREIEVVEEVEETEVYYEHPETYVWGIRGDIMIPRERTRTVRKKVLKEIPNVTTFRVYTENLCQAAEAAVRSKSEVITFTSRRSFSWLVPGMAFLGAPSVSYLLMRQFGVTDYFPVTASLMAGVFLTSWAFPSLWVSEIEDTIHTIKFPAGDGF